ncbi:MAG: hypothetical protein OJF47_003918 [Nitrospira sp.]|jgi:uncharacterized membrane protein YdjX (TVP38/TMEM64 family)|nr:MAG: hypothetical protein OJF47_003918 [Nitrospira sp.]
MTRWIKITLLVIVVGGSVALGRQIDFERALNPSGLADLLHSLGPWGPVMLILSMAMAVIIPPIPSLPLDLASGAAFGPLLGTVYAVVGAAVGAILSFLIGRALGREGISRLLRVDAVFCEKCADHHLGLLIFLARLIPVCSFDVVSYGAGFTTISLRTFSLATIAGMIPPTVAFTYLGSSIASAQWLLIGAGGFLVTVFLLLPMWLKRHRSSRLAQLLFGATTTTVPMTTQPVEPAVCPACGKPFPPAVPTLVSPDPSQSAEPPGLLACKGRC